MKMPTKTKRRAWPVPREQLATVEATVMRVFGLKLDTGRLDDAGRAGLVEITQKLATEGGGINFSQLTGKERTTWERLVAQAAGEPRDYFDKRREDATAFTKIHDLAVQARRPSARPKWEERGAVILSREIVHDWFARPQPVLHVEHVGLLVWLLGQFENGVALARGTYFEGAGDDLVLVVDHLHGLDDGRSYDPDGTIAPAWKRYLEHLETNSFFKVERHGREWRIRRGGRALALTRGRSAS